MSNPIDWLARHVEHDSFFLARLLALYAKSEQLDDVGLAAALGCALETLPRLRLCRPPRPDRFWDDVTSIAAKFDLSPDRLAMVVRRGQVIRDLQKPATAVETLRAARDRIDEAPNGKEPAP